MSGSATLTTVMSSKSMKNRGRRPRSGSTICARAHPRLERTPDRPSDPRYREATVGRPARCGRMRRGPRGVLREHCRGRRPGVAGLVRAQCEGGALVRGRFRRVYAVGGAGIALPGRRCQHRRARTRPAGLHVPRRGRTGRLPGAVGRVPSPRRRRGAPTRAVGLRPLSGLDRARFRRCGGRPLRHPRDSGRAQRGGAVVYTGPPTSRAVTRPGSPSRPRGPRRRMPALRRMWRGRIAKDGCPAERSL